ncbi:hypothetical protein [Streptomyces sp. GSL17-111]|uniref:hypothetical protein n=1 Tax=Streptomyces sp. GSL17-111 TaxID=3121596 RepID=UPI0040408450
MSTSRGLPQATVRPRLRTATRSQYDQTSRTPMSAGPIVMATATDAQSAASPAVRARAPPQRRAAPEEPATGARRTRAFPAVAASEPLTG